RCSSLSSFLCAGGVRDARWLGTYRGARRPTTLILARAATRERPIFSEPRSAQSIILGRQPRELADRRGQEAVVAALLVTRRHQRLRIVPGHRQAPVGG